MTRDPIHLRHADWVKGPQFWRGRVEGDALDTSVTLLFYATEAVGEGPRLAGDVLMGPANVPHKFRNLGPGRLETTDVHLSPRFEQTNLDDPDEGAARQ